MVGITPKHLYSWLGTYDNKMTLIIGAKCKDGVVFIADRKVTEGSQISSQDKIEILEQMGIVFSGAGLTDLFDKFVEWVNINIENRKKEVAIRYKEENDKELDDEEISRIRPYETAQQFIVDCETILKQISDNYRDVIQK